MPSSTDPRDELRALDQKRRTTGLTPEEQARWESLRAAATAASRPADGFDVAAAAAAFHASLPPEPPAWDGPMSRPTSVGWSAGTRGAASHGGGHAPPGDSLPEPAPLPPGTFWDDEAEAPDAAPPPMAVQALGEPLPRPPSAAATAAPGVATPPPLPGAATRPTRTPPMSELGARPPAGAAPSSRHPFRVPGEHRVVIHTIDGQAVRGILVDADLDAREIPAVQVTGEVVRIPAARVKAIFFMLAPGEPAPAPVGTRVRVQFGDGRQVAGLSPDFSPSGIGFFVVPQDGRTNTGRVWVFREAARQVLVG